MAMQSSKLPRLRVTSFISKSGQYLLIKEKIKSLDNKEFWLPPGGGVEYMETLQEAVARESKEETGLDVRCEEFVTIVERVEPENNLHTINLIYRAGVVGGKIKRGKKVLDIGWFSREEALKQNLTKSVREIFIKHLK